MVTSQQQHLDRNGIETIVPPARLVVENLRVDRGGRRVLDGVSLTLSPGEAVLLTGPNGIGKSTLIRAMFGLVRHESGVLRIESQGVEPTEIAPSCHYLGHRDAVKAALTVSENLEFWCRFLNGDCTMVDGALQQVELLDLANLPAGYLSAGQRRRLAISRLLVAPRPIWLLDEPTASLDDRAVSGLVRLMRAHLAGGGSLIAATHLAIDLPGARTLVLTPAEQPE